MRQFLLEYGINPEREPINTVMFHLKAAEHELAETQRLLTQTSAEREHNGRIAEERRKQRDRLAEALQASMRWSDCVDVPNEVQRMCHQALAAVKPQPTEP